MGEWLTTGEMIDNLKDDEIAKSMDGEYEAYWHNGLLKFRDKHGDVQERIIKSDQERKWRIIPPYVSIEEAIQALKEGKEVEFHTMEGDRISFSKDSTLVFHYLNLKVSNFGELLENRWIIKK